jgi:ADP-dependent NAD(P)H-hydrate dehydratase / NAD(P)H-hydrate epimerase
MAGDGVAQEQTTGVREGVRMKVARVKEMQDLDRRATVEFGVSEELLMENAGQAVYFVILQQFGVAGHSFVVFCGSGNNGGDGLVVARKIHSGGGDVKVMLLDDAGKFRGAARHNFEMVSRLAIEMITVASADSVRPQVLECDAIVDAIFGTGLVRDVGGIHGDVIQLINESGKTVFSVDIPSGINGDTGEVMGVAVRADHTVTFGLPKSGNVLYPGYEHCGRLYVSHISFPPALYDRDSIKVAISDPVELPRRARDAHKGSCGKVLCIAGSSRYLGAPYFSATSVLKAGGGLCYLAAPESVVPVVASSGREIVFLAQKETPSGGIALENMDELLEFSQTVDMVILGPGLSLAEETQELVRELTSTIDRPLLVDGDGITALAEHLGSIRKRAAPTILTPHLGEMCRIAKMELGDVSRDRIGVLQRMARELNAVIVLKGAHSLIGYPDEGVFVNVSGNPGMATAGSGDVLTGTIAAMHGLGLALEQAVRMGVFVHGFAGDLAAADRGEDGMTAQDILDYLPEAMKLCREEFAAVSENAYGSIFPV